MPPRAIKHQLTCPFERTSGSFLIGRIRILVFPRNHLVTAHTLYRAMVIKLYFLLGDPNAMSLLSSISMTFGNHRCNAVLLHVRLPCESMLYSGLLKLKVNEIAR